MCCFRTSTCRATWTFLHWHNGCTGARLIRELYSLRVRRGRQAMSRNTRLSFPSPTRRRTLSVSCEAFFLHLRESNRQRGELMSEHAAYSPLPVVLVVENDIFERMFKAAPLRRQGFEVFEAADVAEAVTVLKKITVDLLISDISLIDGAVLAQLAKEHQPTTQIVWTLDSRQSSVETTVVH